MRAINMTNKHNQYNNSKVDHNERREVIGIAKKKTRCYFCNTSINMNIKIVKGKKTHWICQECYTNEAC